MLADSHSGSSGWARTPPMLETPPSMSKGSPGGSLLPSFGHLELFWGPSSMCRPCGITWNLLSVVSYPMRLTVGVSILGSCSGIDCWWLPNPQSYSFCPVASAWQTSIAGCMASGACLLPTLGTHPKIGRHPGASPPLSLRCPFLQLTPLWQWF